MFICNDKSYETFDQALKEAEASKANVLESWSDGYLVRWWHPDLVKAAFEASRLKGYDQGFEDGFYAESRKDFNP